MNQLDTTGTASRTEARLAFEAFFGAHRRGIERFLLGRMQLNPSELDDVTAEVFLVAWRRFEEIRGEPDGAARNWLLKVAELTCLNHRRSTYRRHRTLERVRVHGDVSESFDDVYAEELIPESTAASQVEAVLPALRAGYAEVLRLDMLGDLSGEQMAERLNMSHVALRLRLMRARRAFRAEHQRLFGDTPTAKGEVTDE